MSAVNYDAFRDAITRDTWKCAPIMVASGESFMVADVMQTLRTWLGSQGFVVETFDHEEGSAEALVRALRTSSLFGERVAMFIRSERQGARQEIAVRFKDALLEYCDRPSRQNLLVIEGKSWNGSQAVPKRIKADFLAIDCPEFKPWQIGEIGRFIESRANRLGLSLGPRVADTLREVCAGNLFVVERELEKLQLVAPQGKVDLALVAKHINYRGDDHSFAICDAVTDGERDRALGLAAPLLEGNDPASLIPFLGLLESQLRKLGRLAFALRAQKSPASALAEAGYNPRHPRNDQVIRAARKLDAERIRNHYWLLLEADLAIKSGAPDLAAIMATLISGLSTPAPTIVGREQPASAQGAWR